MAALDTCRAMLAGADPAGGTSNSRTAGSGRAGLRDTLRLVVSAGKLAVVFFDGTLGLSQVGAD